MFLRDWGITWWFITQKEWQMVVYTHRKVVHTLCCRMWIKHEIHTLLQKLDWWQKKKNVKKEIIQSSPPTAMQTKQRQLQISRSRGRWIIKFIKDLNRMQSAEFTRPRRRNEFWQTACTPSLCTSFTERMRRKKLSVKVETRIVCKTTCASKGPKVTLRNIWGHENFDIWCNSGNRDQNCRCKTLTQFYQRVANWSNEELQGRTIQADKESHKDNILSEKAAKKSHEASNCELHETNFKQLFADVNMTFQRIRRWGVHSQGIRRGGVQTLSYIWK